ncbi:MAG: hypothetical protein HKN45_00365 [Flavobacteriales bacterium]|nr:hypothetical protein [Flavobacteriales bacterium]
MRLFIITVIITLFGCGPSTEVIETPKTTSLDKKPVRVEMGFEEKTDPFLIESAKTEGTDLYLTVSYSGGCEGHVFELFTDGTIMKSLPPKQRFFLRHYANGDKCETQIKEEVVFDMKGTTNSGNSLILLLDKYKGDLRMDF